MTIPINADQATSRLVAIELTRFKSQLENKRWQINKEIGSYPAPIPACDLQFNHLLEERSQISAKLKMIETLLEQCQTKIIGVENIDELFKMSNQIDNGLADRLKSALSPTDR